MAMGLQFKLDGGGRFGDEYEYCFIDDVHIPSSEEELQSAFAKSYEKWKKEHKTQ